MDEDSAMDLLKPLATLLYIDKQYAFSWNKK